MNVKYRKLTETAKTPEKQTKGSAGYDLYVDIASPIMIPPHETIKFNTNIAVQIPEGYFGAIYARSGISTKRSLRPCNCVGVIDSDYINGIVVPLHNDSDKAQVVYPNERIAQLIIQQYSEVSWEEVEELNMTERGYGGFGSTGH